MHLSNARSSLPIDGSDDKRCRIEPVTRSWIAYVDRSADIVSTYCAQPVCSTNRERFTRLRACYTTQLPPARQMSYETMLVAEKWSCIRIAGYNHLISAERRWTVAVMPVGQSGDIVAGGICDRARIRQRL